MNTQLLRARQTKYAAYATVYILVVVSAVVIVNVLANRYNKSYDATANKRYSLSDQTAKIVKGLKQDATITYFDQAARFAHAKDLLGEGLVVSDLEVERAVAYAAGTLKLLVEPGGAAALAALLAGKAPEGHIVLILSGGNAEFGIGGL